MMQYTVVCILQYSSAVCVCSRRVFTVYSCLIDHQHFLLVVLSKQKLLFKESQHNLESDESL